MWGSCCSMFVFCVVFYSLLFVDIVWGRVAHSLVMIVW